MNKITVWSCPCCGDLEFDLDEYHEEDREAVLNLAATFKDIAAAMCHQKEERKED